MRATSPTPRPTSASATAIDGAATPGLLPRDPAVPVRRGRQGPRRGRPDEDRPRRRREAVRPRPRVRPRARRRAAPVHRRVAALPDRPLPREDGPRGDPLPPLREHDARAGLEPELRRVRRRSRWPRTSASRTAATSTTRSARCATSSSTTSCRSSRPPRWSRPPAATRRRSRTRRSRSSARSPTADPAHYVRGQYDGYLDDRRRRAGLDDRDVRRAAPRHRQLALVGRPVLHPHRQAPAGDADRAPARLQAPAAARLRARSSGRPEPNQLVVKLDPSTGVRLVARRPPRPTRRERGADRRSTWSSPRRAARARRRTRCCCTPRWSARARASRARTASRRRWRIMQPLLDAPPPVHPYAPGSWGPEAADELVAGHGRWHGPWVTS